MIIILKKVEVGYIRKLTVEIGNGFIRITKFESLKISEKTLIIKAA